MSQAGKRVEPTPGAAHHGRGRRALVAWVVLAAGSAAPTARAGDYHSNATLRCNDCHVMHFSQSHGYPADGRLGVPRGLAYGPNRALLASPVNDLCLTCHDGSSGATDVLDAVNTGSQMGIVRGAGYLDRFGSPGAHGGHTLDALDSAPSSQPSWSPQNENGPGQGLTCTNCHDPHGEAASGHPTGSQYRNLRVDPGHATQAWVTYNSNEGVNDIGRDVFVRHFGRYDESEVDWNEPDPQRSAIARWCLGCHGAVHGASGGGYGGALREHPFEGEDLESSMLSRYNSKANRVKVTSEIGVWYPAGRDVTPTCITCHRAHGNRNPFGLIFRSGTGTPTENGDTNGTSRADLCLQCHDSPNPD